MLVKGIVLIGALGIDINLKRSNQETSYDPNYSPS
jgi:hypothetical protein